MLKCNISDVYSDRYAKIKIDLYDDLPLVNLTFSIVIESPFIKNQNNCYHKTFL